ncbi:MAG: hypothetical protein IKN42_03485 [Elusimicrobia bacterium]|nr:hypothetical protein [Elusimicrobiota bacterium]
MFLILCLASNLCADISGNHIQQKENNENKNVAYLGLEKKVSEETNVKNNNKYNEKKYLDVTGEVENTKKQFSENYDVNGVFSLSNFLSNKKSVKYNITGIENKFNLSDKELKSVYNIDGTEIVRYSKKAFLTKYQKAQIEYLEMERKYKTLVLDNEIKLKKKMLDEELASDFSDVFLIDELSKDIKSLAIDKETVYINVEKKIRYVLSPDQYLKYKQKQNKKNKK